MKNMSVLDVARASVQQSVRHLAAFSNLWRKRGAALTETIRATFPIVREGGEGITESTAGPDPIGSAGTPVPEVPGPTGPATA